MMMNLFSIFDPSMTIKLIKGWMILPMILVMFPNILWINKTFQMMLKMIKTYLKHEFSSIIDKKNHMFMILVTSMFMFIFFNNFFGLMPYIFNSTSHLTITMFLAFPLWLSMNIYGWMKMNKSMLAHLVPQATPSVLMPFMVIIETISSVIRPMTLAIRLMANMIAGHLLMTLLGNQLVNWSVFTLMPLLLTQIILSTLEMAVSIIQAYVFSVLLTLYINEIPAN